VARDTYVAWLPYAVPHTLHEAFRASLIRANGITTNGKREEGRPRTAATREFRSLRTIGPLPLILPDSDDRMLVCKQNRFGEETGVEVSYSGLLLPVPLDIAFETVERRGRAPDNAERKWIESVAMRRFRLWREASAEVPQAGQKRPSSYRLACLPVAVTPPNKHDGFQAGGPWPNSGLTSKW
jgi:hypothetical protein